MSSLVTVQVLKGNNSTQQIGKDYVFSGNPIDLEISELSNNHLVSQETVRQPSFRAHSYNSGV